MQESRSMRRKAAEARLGRACFEAKPPAFLLKEKGAREALEHKTDSGGCVERRTDNRESRNPSWASIASNRVKMTLTADTDAVL